MHRKECLYLLLDGGFSRFKKLPALVIGGAAHGRPFHELFDFFPTNA